MSFCYQLVQGVKQISWIHVLNLCMTICALCHFYLVKLWCYLTFCPGFHSFRETWYIYPLSFKKTHFSQKHIREVYYNSTRSILTFQWEHTAKRSLFVMALSNLIIILVVPYSPSGHILCQLQLTRAFQSVLTVKERKTGYGLGFRGER